MLMLKLSNAARKKRDKSELVWAYETIFLLFNIKSHPCGQGNTAIAFTLTGSVPKEPTLFCYKGTIL